MFHGPCGTRPRRCSRRTSWRNSSGRSSWEAGIVGANIEDSFGGAPPVEIHEQVELLRSVREAAPELVLNARVDTFVRRSGGVEETIERGNAYLEAGADCVFPITISD